MSEPAPQYNVTVEVDPQAILKAYNHAKGMVKHLGRLLGREVEILESHCAATHGRVQYPSHGHAIPPESD